MTPPDAYACSITVTDGSFRVVFRLGSDVGQIRDATGWITESLQLSDGSCEDILTEAHRLIDLAVATSRYPSYYPTVAAAEDKRVLTSRYRSARTTHHPRWQSSRRHTRYGGDSGR